MAMYLKADSICIGLCVIKTALELKEIKEKDIA